MVGWFFMVKTVVNKKSNNQGELQMLGDVKRSYEQVLE